jgi:hypothetical protein
MEPQWEREERDPGVESRPPYTRHARGRGARRNVEPDAVDYVLAHGRMIQRTGVTFYFLGRRDMPASDRGTSWAARLEGTIILQASDGAVITLYRNRRGAHAIARKLKYRWLDASAHWPDACARASA